MKNLLIRSFEFFTLVTDYLYALDFKALASVLRIHHGLSKDILKEKKTTCHRFLSQVWHITGDVIYTHT